MTSPIVWRKAGGVTWVVAGLVLALDIAVKVVMLRVLAPLHPTVVIPGFFNLSLVFNRGAAFGILPGAAIIFMVLAAVTIAVILAWSVCAKDAGTILRLSMGLICGGAAGNMLDRLRFGYVVDFLDFYALTWHWPAFNVADASICIGAGLLIVHTLITTHASHPS